jgi:septum formation protein
VLASGSASRGALLKAAGLTFVAMPPQVDEDAVKRQARMQGLPPAGAALLLAQAKASAVIRREQDALVLGCDQLLVCGGEWYDKPAGLEQARTQLRALRGRTHTLVTAAVCCRAEQRLWQAIACPALTMRQFSDVFLEEYLLHEKQNVTASVGGYRLEGPGVHLFAAVEGEHAAILGLPLLALLDFLRRYGLLVD